MTKLASCRCRSLGLIPIGHQRQRTYCLGNVGIVNSIHATTISTTSLKWEEEGIFFQHMSPKLQWWTYCFGKFPHAPFNVGIVNSIHGATISTRTLKWGKGEFFPTHESKVATVDVLSWKIPLRPHSCWDCQLNPWDDNFYNSIEMLLSFFVFTSKFSHRIQCFD